MSSELELDFYTTMRDIESREEDLREAGERNEESQSFLGRKSGLRTLLVAILAILVIALVVYLLHLAGFFAAPRGQLLWRGAYRSLSDDYQELESLHGNQSRSLSQAREEKEKWENEAEWLRSALEARESRLDEIQAEIEICREELGRTRGELEKARCEYLRAAELLNRTRRERDDYRSLSSVLRHELCVTRSNLTAARRELEIRMAELASLREEVKGLQEQLEASRDDRDQWISRLHELELEYQELMCRLKICELEEARWRDLYLEELAELEEALERCGNRTRSLSQALDDCRSRNRELRAENEEVLLELERVISERDRWKEAYRELNRSYRLLQEELGALRERCANISAALEEVTRERDRWENLYGELEASYRTCLSRLEYWRNRCDELMADLETVQAENEELSDQLEECSSRVNELEATCDSLQEELDQALSSVEYWHGLYDGLWNITLSLEIGNISVLDRECGKPSRISAEIMACVSTTESPMYLFLEYWAEPLDCVWGYGTITEEVSQWESTCKTFNVTLDFGTGVGPYKVISKGRLQPIHGAAEAEKRGPD